MPVVGVNRDRLFRALGEEYSELYMPVIWRSYFFMLWELISISLASFAAEEEFDELCFEYGIELDDVVRYLLLT